MQTNSKNDIITSIIKECYWDYNITEKDIIKIVNSEDTRLKQKLFSKIIYNSSDRLKGLRIFKKDDLKVLFDTFNPAYQDKIIKRHVLVLRNILLNEKNKIEGLEWRKR